MFSGKVRQCARHPLPFLRAHLTHTPSTKKTTELLRRVRRYTLARRRVVVVNHSKDTRHGGGCIGTHDHATWTAISSDTLNTLEISAAVADADVVAVDEGQFFHDLKATSEWADSGKIVIVAALDSKFDRTPFETVRDLVADDVTKLTAVCYVCGHDAGFTRRLTDETDAEVVGGSEKYQAVCRACYVATNSH